VKPPGGINVVPLKVKQFGPLHIGGISTVVRRVQGRANRVIVGVMVAVVKQVGRVVRRVVVVAEIRFLLTDRHGHALVVGDVEVEVLVGEIGDVEDVVVVLDVVIVVVLKVKSVVKKVEVEEMGVEVVGDVVEVGEVGEVEDVGLVVDALVGSSVHVELHPQFW
jgi:hypothetical protein